MQCRSLQGLQSVANEQTKLTLRELECLRWVAAGKSDLQTAKIMGLSAVTVKGHVDKARQKLGARTRPQAVVRLILAGLS